MSAPPGQALPLSQALLFSQALPLGAWQNFYVIVGSSAAALTGLTFIVVTIATDRNPTVAARSRLLGVRAFITPTVVQFGAALAMSAVLSMPGQTAVTLAACLLTGGLAGIIYCGAVIRSMLQMYSDYTPFLADWIWSAVLPLLAYLCLLIATWLLLERFAAALYLIAGVTLLLLFIGIHNAWDVVAWITAERHARAEHRRHADSSADR